MVSKASRRRVVKVEEDLTFQMEEEELGFVENHERERRARQEYSGLTKEEEQCDKYLTSD